MEYLSKIAEQYSNWTAPKNMETVEQTRPVDPLYSSPVAVFVDRVVKSSDLVTYRTPVRDEDGAVTRYVEGFKLNRHGKEMIQKHSEAVKDAPLSKLVEELDTIRQLKSANETTSDRSEVRKHTLDALNRSIEIRMRDAVRASLSVEELEQFDKEVAQLVADRKAATKKERENYQTIQEKFDEKANQILSQRAEQRKAWKHFRSRRGFIQHAGQEAVRLTSGGLLINLASDSARLAGEKTSTGRTSGDELKAPVEKGQKVAVAGAVQAPQPDAKIQSVVPEQDVIEDLVNKEMHLGEKINLELDFVFNVPGELAEKIGMKKGGVSGLGFSNIGGESGQELLFDVESVPQSKDESPTDHKNISQRILDMFSNLKQHANIGAIFRTDIPENNMIWAHDLTYKDEALPLEWMKRLHSVYKENPDAVKGQVFFIEQKGEDGKTVRQAMEIIEMHELPLQTIKDSMNFFPEGDSPIYFDTGVLGLSLEARMPGVVHLTTCSGELNWEDPEVASMRTILCARAIEA